MAAARLAALDPDATLAILPADHHIGDEGAFSRTLEACLDAAERTTGDSTPLVTCGIKPSHPETGFGYIEVAAGQTATRDGALPVLRFVEKPSVERAKEFVASGRFFWNSGMFFFRARRMLAEIGRTLPALGGALGEIGAALTRGGVAAAAEVTARLYPGLPSVSVDVGVMERPAASWWCPATSRGTTSAAGARWPRCGRPTPPATCGSAPRWPSTPRSRCWCRVTDGWWR